MQREIDQRGVGIKAVRSTGSLEGDSFGASVHGGVDIAWGLDRGGYAV